MASASKPFHWKYLPGTPVSPSPSPWNRDFENSGGMLLVASCCVCARCPSPHEQVTQATITAVTGTEAPGSGLITQEPAGERGGEADSVFALIEPWCLFEPSMRLASVFIVQSEQFLHSLLLVGLLFYLRSTCSNFCNRENNMLIKVF